jgi:hypothetical protein
VRSLLPSRSIIGTWATLGAFPSCHLGRVICHPVRSFRPRSRSVSCGGVTDGAGLFLPNIRLTRPAATMPDWLAKSPWHALAHFAGRCGAVAWFAARPYGHRPRVANDGTSMMTRLQRDLDTQATNRSFSQRRPHRNDMPLAAANLAYTAGTVRWRKRSGPTDGGPWFAPEARSPHWIPKCAS